MDYLHLQLDKPTVDLRVTDASHESEQDLEPADQGDGLIYEDPDLELDNTVSDLSAGPVPVLQPVSFPDTEKFIA